MILNVTLGTGSPASPPSALDLPSPQAPYRPCCPVLQGPWPVPGPHGLFPLHLPLPVVTSNAGSKSIFPPKSSPTSGRPQLAIGILFRCQRFHSDHKIYNHVLCEFLCFCMKVLLKTISPVSTGQAGTSGSVDQRYDRDSSASRDEMPSLEFPAGPGGIFCLLIAPSCMHISCCSLQDIVGAPRLLAMREHGLRGSARVTGPGEVTPDQAAACLRSL